MQSRGQTVNLSESFEIESLSILHGIARNYTDGIARRGRHPNARLCHTDSGFSCRIVIAPHKTAARDSSPLGSPDWQMGRESCGMTNRSSRFQRMRGNYAPTDSSFRNCGAILLRRPAEWAVRADAKLLLWKLSYHFMHTLLPHGCANAVNRSTNFAQCSVRKTRRHYLYRSCRSRNNFHTKYLSFIWLSSIIYIRSTLYIHKRHLLFKILYTIPFPISKICFL